MYKIVKLYLALIIFFVYNSKAIAQNTEFYKEKIVVSIEGKKCVITGQYWFRNNYDKNTKRSFYYPYVLSDSLPEPDYLKVFQIVENNKKKISYTKLKNGIIFPITILSKDSLIFEVQYSQETPYNKIEYILTTTQNWGKPLAQAEYIINIPNEYQLKYCSINHKKVNDSQNQVTYKIFKKDFMPKKNLIITWEARR